MPLIDGNVTRCDIRIPNDLYDQIESLAIERKAKIHHRSGKPEVTSTILELIEIGLTYRHLSDNSSDSLSGNLSDEAFEDLAARVYDRLSDLISDNLAPVSDLPDKISDIEGEMKKRPTKDDLDQALEPILKDLALFDKAFQGLGSTVHDHDQMLSQPVATKEDLQTVISALRTEIESLKKL